MLMLGISPLAIAHGCLEQCTIAICQYLLVIKGFNVNVYAGSGWVLTALGFNGAEQGHRGFTGTTNYSSWLTQQSRIK